MAHRVSEELEEASDSADRVFKKGDKVWHRGAKMTGTVMCVIKYSDKTLEIKVLRDKREDDTIHTTETTWWASYHTEQGELPQCYRRRKPMPPPTE